MFHVIGGKLGSRKRKMHQIGHNSRSEETNGLLRNADKKLAFGGRVLSAVIEHKKTGGNMVAQNVQKDSCLGWEGLLYLLLLPLNYQHSPELPFYLFAPLFPHCFIFSTLFNV